MTLKIIEQTPSRLTIQDRISQSIQSSRLLAGGFLVAIFIVTLVWMRYTGKVSLTCNRTRPDRVSCTQYWVPVLGKSQRILLGNIRSAKIEQQLRKYSPTKKIKYIIMLDTDSGVIPFVMPVDRLGSKLEKSLSVG